MLNRYKEVVMLNEELLTGCYIRRSTQEQAVTALKNLHTILQQAVRLRGTLFIRKSTIKYVPIHILVKAEIT